MTRLRALVGLAAGAPLLAGCVIYASEGGEKVAVNVTDAAPAQELEAVRKADFDGQRLNVVVGSNGCTEATHFEVMIKAGAPSELSLVRQTPDLCRALVPEGKALSWTYEELGLRSGDAVRIMNPVGL